MSSKGSKYLTMPSGMDLGGENTGPLPDRGTSRGFTGKPMHHIEGADTHADATNRRGGFKATSDTNNERHMPKPSMKGRS